MENLKVLVVHSFAVHGMASLKVVTRILGSRVLPVPSLMLNGLTNMHGISKFDTPFRELLTSTLELSVYRQQKLVLYIGYLGNPENADILIELVRAYREHIAYIIIDPVCGDHGRMYVPQEVADKWKELIPISDIVFPNLCEVRILTGNDPDGREEPEIYISKFLSLFPDTELVVTSMAADGQIGIESYGEERFSYYHPKLQRNYSGSGDAFVAFFIESFFYKLKSKEESLVYAAQLTSGFIQQSIAMNSDELIIEF